MLVSLVSEVRLVSFLILVMDRTKNSVSERLEVCCSLCLVLQLMFLLL